MRVMSTRLTLFTTNPLFNSFVPAALTQSWFGGEKRLAVCLRCKRTQLAQSTNCGDAATAALGPESHLPHCSDSVAIEGMAD
jgi:hypothetical protein